MASKKNRKMKVYGTSGYKYKNTPTIILKGIWLEKSGFEIGEEIEVKCEKDRLLIVKERRVILSAFIVPVLFTQHIF